MFKYLFCQQDLLLSVFTRWYRLLSQSRPWSRGGPCLPPGLAQHSKTWTWWETTVCWLPERQPVNLPWLWSRWPIPRNFTLYRLECFFLHLLLSSLLACLWLVVYLVIWAFALKLLHIFNQRGDFSQPAIIHGIHIVTPAYVHTLLLFIDLSLPVISTCQSSPPGHVPSVQRNQLWETSPVYSSS